MADFNFHESLIALLSRIENPFLFVGIGGERIYWRHVVWAIVIAAVVYWRASSSTFSVREFLRYVFPKSVYNSRSAWVDYGWFFLFRPIFGLMALPAAVAIGPKIAVATQQFLRNWVPAAQDVLPGGPFAMVLFTVVAIVAADFGAYLAHLMQHRSPLLWEFHKVHHSAQELTPITAYRMHPLDDVLGLILSGTALAVINGLFQFLTIGPIGIIGLLGVNIFTGLFLMFGANLRHSHIWVDYGPRVSRFLISPAQHQIHHSTALQHRDRNLGQIFAFWDGLFGTLYVPESHEQITYGIDGQEEAEFSNPLRLFWLPFRKLFLWPGARGVALGTAMSALVLTLGVASAAGILSEEHVDKTQVRMEEMTWQEVQGRVKAGATTVLVPTAGQEQNGPHMILGKHRYVVDFTSTRIANELGNTLVAPVMTYVPEGTIDPPEQHMNFAGTISISPEVFEAVLEYTARSLRAHGFELICFLGDSGGNQDSQAKVAALLNEEWKAEKTRVLQVDHYYSKNHQLEWLTEQGIPASEVGTHAGVRDTSELLYILPQGIRRNRIWDGAHDGAMGVNGDPTRASAELGRKLVDLKIQAAVEQIGAARSERPPRQ